MDEEISALFKRFPTPNPEELEATTLQREKEWRKECRAQFKQRRADGVLVLEMLAAGHRSVAKRLHPDLGGSTDAMVRLTKSRDQSEQVRRQFGIKAKPGGQVS